MSSSIRSTKTSAGTSRIRLSGMTFEKASRWLPFSHRERYPLFSRSANGRDRLATSARDNARRSRSVRRYSPKALVHGSATDRSSWSYPTTPSSPIRRVTGFRFVIPRGGRAGRLSLDESTAKDAPGTRRASGPPTSIFVSEDSRGDGPRTGRRPLILVSDRSPDGEPAAAGDETERGVSAPLDRSGRVAVLCAALDVASTPVALLDGRGVIAFVNRAWAGGGPAGAPFGERFVVGADYRASLRRQESDAAATVADAVDQVIDGRVERIEVALTVERGPVDARAWSVRVEQSETETEPWLVVSHHDGAGTAGSGAEEAAPRPRTEAELVCTLGDEIRDPLNSIVATVDLTLGTALTREQVEQLTSVRSAAETLATVFNDLLDLAKIDTGRLELEHIPFNLRDSLLATLEPLAARAHRKGVELQYQIAQDVPRTVLGDPTRLRQVLATLIDDAVDSTPGGRIDLLVKLEGTEPAGKRVRFEVRDTGRLVSREEVARRLDPRASTSALAACSGRGVLGLVVSSELARLMGAPIEIAERAGRGGSLSFAVDLPPCAETTELRLAPPESLRGLRVLVAEGNAVNRRVVREALEPHGVEVMACDDGVQAWARLSRSCEAGEPYDLALLDVRMPGIDGFALARRMRQEPAFARLPLILLTVMGQRGDAARCREAGVEGYLAKPFEAGQVLEAVRALVAGDGGKRLVTRHSLRELRRRWQVLVVEDNEANRRLVRAILEKQGHTVHLAHDGEQALCLFGERPFDLVLMDIQMPAMDGMEATRRIRELERGTGRRVPIIAQTAHAMDADRRRFLAADMDGYVSKPFKFAALLEVIERLAPAARSMPGADVEPGAAAHEAPARPLVDRAALVDQTGGDATLLSEIIDLYVEDRSGMVDKVARAVELGDVEAVRMEAHKLKGTFRTLAANGAADDANQLERMAREGRLERASGVVERIREAALQVERELVQIQRQGAEVGE